MAGANKEVDRGRTTVKLGEYKKGKETKTVYSRMLKTTAAKLKLVGKDSGFSVATDVTKGKGKGAKYKRLIMGGSSEQYVLLFGKARSEVKVGKKTVGSYYRKINVPVPAGTPLAVIATFCKTLNPPPSKIATPTGTIHFFTKSKAK